MGIFHKLFIGIKRKLQGGGVAYVSEAKRYGNEAEDSFEREIKHLLPECEIKSNVIVHLSEEKADAEVDCLVLYCGYLFAVEVKHWKGVLTENGDKIVQRKQDRWTDEIHTDVKKSPFKQVKRSISLLKKETGSNYAWIEPIVLFQGATWVDIKSEDNWFADVRDLAHFVRVLKLTVAYMAVKILSALMFNIIFPMIRFV